MPNNENAPNQYNISDPIDQNVDQVTIRNSGNFTSKCERSIFMQQLEFEVLVILFIIANDF